MPPAWLLGLLLPTFLCLKEGVWRIPSTQGLDAMKVTSHPLCLHPECGTQRNTPESSFCTWQPCHLSIQAKESVTLPCTFNYSWRMDPDTEIRVFWRLGGFHSPIFLFNHTGQKVYTHPKFTSRISLVGNLSNRHNASIQICNLTESDSDIYLCRISIQTNGKWESWQSIYGTNLTVTAGVPAQSNSILGPVVGAVLAGLVVLLGLLLFFSWRKGCCQEGLKARRAGGCGKEERAACAEPEEDRSPGAGAPNPAGPPQLPSRPLKAPEKPYLLYATLSLSAAGKEEEETTRRPPRTLPGGQGQETTYAVLRL